MTEVDRQLGRIEMKPGLFPTWHYGTQRALLRRFPYQIIFHLEDDTITILHCDIKPANILMDDQGSVRLVDLGQARLLAEQGGSLGTLWYMSPEQVDAWLSHSSPCTSWDIYSLGAAFYGLLTDRLPRVTEELRRDLKAEPNSVQRLRRYREGGSRTPLIAVRDLNPRVVRISPTVFGPGGTTGGDGTHWVRNTRPSANTRRPTSGFFTRAACGTRPRNDADPGCRKGGVAARRRDHQAQPNTAVGFALSAEVKAARPSGGSSQGRPTSLICDAN